MNIQTSEITVGLIQINNSFSGANYLPYSVGLLQASIEKYFRHKNRFHFLQPVFKRTSVEKAISQILPAQVVGFSLYVWNEQISLEIIRQLKKKKP